MYSILTLQLCLESKCISRMLQARQASSVNYRSKIPPPLITPTIIYPLSCYIHPRYILPLYPVPRYIPPLYAHPSVISPCFISSLYIPPSRYIPSQKLKSWCSAATSAFSSSDNTRQLQISTLKVPDSGAVTDTGARMSVHKYMKNSGQLGWDSMTANKLLAVTPRPWCKTHSL